MKKICFVQLKVIGYFDVNLGVTPGGAERQIFHLMNFCAQNSELEVHALVGDFGQEPIVVVGHIKLWRSCKLMGNPLVRVWKLFRTLQQIHADLYVFRSPDIGVALGALLVKLLRNRVVYMVANEDEAVPTKLQKICGTVGSRAMAWLYKSADVLITQTQQQAELFKVHRKINVSGILPNIFSKTQSVNPQSASQVSGVSDFSKILPELGYILWVGRCDPIKRAELYLDLAEQNPNNKFVMVCPKTSFLAYWDEIFARAQNIKNLTFIEKVSPDEIYTWYQRAKLLVMTSVSEGFSNVMMEALYEKCPLLTLNVNPDNIIHRFKLGNTFCDAEMALFFQAFRNLLADEVGLQQMGEAGRRYIEEFHGVETNGRRFLKLVNEAF